MEADDFNLDEARETLFILQRACERHAAALVKVVEGLNSKQPDDEWLLEVLDEAAKGKAFHQQQQAMFANFHERAHAYVEAVRNEANQLALQELARDSGQQEGTLEEDDGDDEAASTSGSGSAAAGGAAAATPGQRRKSSTSTTSSKMVHPELLKFKLEKQAKILGKYGGMPALGAGLVLPRLQRDAILKATGSPAAREIHYSKVENKDASNLAEVMRFKVRKGEEGGANGGTPAPSPWQAELSTKKGKSALDGTDQKDLVTPSTRSHAVYGEELGGVLQQRQAALEEAMAAQRATPLAAAAVGPQISSDAMGELATKLRRRQSAAKQMEAEAEAAAAEAAEAEAPPSTPAWSNVAAPFGGELTAALLRRAEQQRQGGSSGGGGGQEAAEAGPGADGRGEGAAAAAAAAASTTVRPSGSAVKPVASPSPTPNLSGGPPLSAAAPSTSPLASLASSSAAPATPAGGFATPAAAPRRFAAPAALAGMLATPPGAAVGAAAAATNELQEKLRRRLSALDGQTPSPPPPPV